jgi:hypothetical protein
MDLYYKVVSPDYKYTTEVNHPAELLCNAAWIWVN